MLTSLLRCRYSAFSYNIKQTALYELEEMEHASRESAEANLFTLQASLQAHFDRDKKEQEQIAILGHRQHKEIQKFRQLQADAIRAAVKTHDPLERCAAAPAPCPHCPRLLPCCPVEPSDRCVLSVCELGTVPRRAP